MKFSKTLQILAESCCPEGAWLAIALLASAIAARAAVIDFEQINMAIPYEGMQISNQFQAQFGVTFSRSNTGNKPVPVLAHVSAPQGAFDRDSANMWEVDKPTDAFTNLIGNFMLTDIVGGGGDAAEQLRLDYSGPVSRVSGYVLDIDGTEQINIVAYSETNGLVAVANLVLTAGEPGTGDGVATFWQITRPTKEIRRVTIFANGNHVAYDNFDSDYAPPLPAPQLGIGMVAGLNISGQIGRRYQIDYADRLDITPGNTNWHVLTTNLFLPTTNYLFVDTNATATQRFYRAAAMH